MEPWKDLTGEVVMVTGASSGIGQEFCLDLAKAGCRIIASARRVDRLKTLCNQININSEGLARRAIAVQLDITADNATIEAAVQIAWDAFGRIDVLINNAGLRGNVYNSLDLPEEEWEHTYKTNLRGACSNTWGLAYGSSKMALDMVTKMMALELGVDNIRVNSISPGIFKSEITKSLMEKEWINNVIVRTVPLRTFGTTDPALTSTVRLKPQVTWLTKYLNKNPLGRVFGLATTLNLGWPLYLAFNASGRPYPRFASHYHPHGPSYYDRERLQIYISDAGVIATTYVLYRIALAQGLTWLIPTFCIIYSQRFEATRAIKPLLGEYYQFDSTPFYKALWRDYKECIYVEKDERSEDRGFFVGDIKKAIPPHCFQRSLFRSFSYLVQDLMLVSVFYYIASSYFHFLPSPYYYLAWPIYWIFQGCVCTGIWVIAHECGHQAFSDYQWINDTVGFIFHSALLTPYFSWKYSHRRHHSNTNSLEHDENHVPKLKTKLRWYTKLYMNNPLGRLLILAFTLTIGLPLYYAINIAGRPYDRFASHYDPYSPIYNDRERLQIYISDAGLIATIYVLYRVALTQGLTWVVCIYGVPLLIVSGFIVLITLLHHTHASLPHYDSSEWDWLRGALATVDRDYGVLTKVFHNITDTHVVHHLFSSIPHYHAMEATKAVRPLLGEYYQFDGTPFYKAIWRDFGCIYVEKDDEATQGKGIFWYKNNF
ncbi:hypothetical protein H5410_058825 [Solanum commersonii]|uniref:Fatty acid desaturase domain-containing protein n=1 Tax=Solanum commersonii TaxID=4109 RepID=A0A9J5W0P0_SOLCO|nr:hypothetical protein H5410_058825 [Solanum commersonii]